MFRTMLGRRSSINTAFTRRIIQNTFPALSSKMSNKPTEAKAAPRRSDRLINLAKSSNRFYSANTTQGNRVFVEHDSQANQFYIEFKNEGRAYLDYELEDGLMVLVHTNVPPELEGRGLGRILAKKALEHVAENNLELEINCDFVLHYVNKYEPKYKVYMRK